MVLPIYDNDTRPDALGLPAGFEIWNSEDRAPNYADGKGNWRDALGNLT